MSLRTLPFPHTVATSTPLSVDLVFSPSSLGFVQLFRYRNFFARNLQSSPKMLGTQRNFVLKLRSIHVQGHINQKALRCKGIPLPPKRCFSDMTLPDLSKRFVIDRICTQQLHKITLFFL